MGMRYSQGLPSSIKTRRTIKEVGEGERDRKRELAWGDETSLSFS